MTKIDLITGFLGAGKTTFLLKYAKHLIANGEKIGILEYDYGAVNIDMILLGELRGPKCELEMLAAACDEDCLRRRFKTKLIAMAMTGYDRVIIEPSGVFDMDMFFDTLLEEPLDNWYEIGSVIDIVNANADDISNRESDFILASQAVGAGRIVFSKTQFCTAEKIENMKEHILQSAAKIGCPKIKGQFVTKHWDDLSDDDLDDLSHAGYGTGDYMKLTKVSESNFSSVYFLELPRDVEFITNKVKELFENCSRYGDVFRVKGLISDSSGSYQLNATKDKLTLTPKSSGSNALIVIGQNINEKIIKETFGMIF